MSEIKTDYTKDSDINDEMIHKTSPVNSNFSDQTDFKSENESTFRGNAFDLKSAKNILFGGIYISQGVGTPEGIITAPIGSLYTRTDGGTGTTLYRKESGAGNTGWVAVSSGTPGGSDTQVQFNDGGSFGGDSQLTFNKTTGETIFTGISAAGSTHIIGGLIQTGIDGGLNLSSGNSSATATGKDIQVIASDGGATSGSGGDVIISGGDSVGSAGSGGAVNLEPGNGMGTGLGGFLQIISGNGGTTGSGGSGGEVNITSGNGGGTDGVGGDINITPGSSNASTNGTIVFNGVGGNGGRFYHICGGLTTTNATPTNINTDDSPSNYFVNNSTLFIEAVVSSRRTGGTAGSAGDCAGYIRRAVYKNIAGVTSLVGSIQDDFTAEDQAGWDCTFVISGTDILVQVTGATNNNITWQYQLKYLTVLS